MNVVHRGEYSSSLAPIIGRTLKRTLLLVNPDSQGSDKNSEVT